MAGLATLARNFLNFFLWAVCEVSWVVVARHVDGYKKRRIDNQFCVMLIVVLMIMNTGTPCWSCQAI